MVFSCAQRTCGVAHNERLKVLMVAHCAVEIGCSLNTIVFGSGLNVGRVLFSINYIAQINAFGLIGKIEVFYFIYFFVNCITLHLLLEMVNRQYHYHTC